MNKRQLAETELTVHSENKCLK